MEKISTIATDPFARVDTVRRVCSKGKECAWCGKPARFNYGFSAHSIGSRTSFDEKSFCSIGCRRSFYE